MTDEIKTCEGCGNEEPERIETCPHCGADKCDLCDMGDNVECGNCPDEG
ncbi:MULTISPECIES: hypothetical protein [Buttiauxella]|nr:hypothetical protein [Buttiauxella agrestis]